MDKPLAGLEKKIGLKFKDENNLRQSMVHRSYLNEHPSFPLPHNERLEFLGDAVLELVVTNYLYHHYENPEGELTNWRSALVKTDNLSRVAGELGLDEHLLLSKGEERSNGRGRLVVLANAMEALIGAVYLDQGYDAAASFIEKHILSGLKKILDEKLHVDPKSRLQEITQEKMGITPNYQVLSETGPDHDKVFTVAVLIGDKEIGRGTGASKQAAQQEAAISALKQYK